MTDIAVIGRKVRENVRRVLVGRERAVELALVALACEGHILIEDVPGVGKTTLARALAVSLGLECRRIQFTPDLLPSDITGVSVYNQRTGEFEFRPGPVFTNILLADEINRATPRTQAALLECMEERQVSVDGIPRPVPRPFLVMATQNPVEYEGTFPLPEAQLDRFMLCLDLGYPTPDEFITILERVRVRHPLENLRPVLVPEEIQTLQAQVKEVRCETSLKRYIGEIVAATRQHEEIALGASPRAGIALFKAAQALAGLRGRSYVIPEDLKELAGPVLAHRLVLKPEARMRGLDARQAVAQVLARVPVPTEEVIHAE
ncbi:MAG: MoxR family ATPase [Firmicutes bacterium]|nr:MoxR family ATPase [Bacillota bacterium]